MRKNTVKFALAAALLAGLAAAAVADEAQLIAVIRSDAPLKDKVDACRELARVATGNSVPALAALLGDEKISTMARGALETIPNPAAGAALREALGRLQGRPLMGVIGSLGVRRDNQAVPALAKLLADTEAGPSAARALGQIGTAEAAAALEAALPGTAANQGCLCEGLFRAAEALAASGQSARSLAIYDRLRSLSGAAPQVRVGALRGAILGRGKDGIPLMVEALRGDDYALTAAAARAAIELPGAEVTAALVAELPKLPADKQILVANTLGYRGDASAGAALLALGAKGPDAVRLAAVQNFTHLGYAAGLPLLAELALGAESELATAARECLANFPGREADATIVAMLSHKDPKVRGLAVEMITQRNAAGAIGALLKAAQDAEESVRLTALQSLREQAGEAELPALLAVLVKARSAAELQAAESALGALCVRLSQPGSGNIVIFKAVYGDLPDGPSADVTKKVADLVKAGAGSVDASNRNFGDPASRRVKKLFVEYSVNGAKFSNTVRESQTVTFVASSTPAAVVEAICGAADVARGEAKLALLRTLRAAGGAKALEAVRKAAADADEEVQDMAARQLCEWPTPDALPLLAEMAKNSPNKKMKVLALRGFVRLVPQQTVADARKVAALKEAMDLAERSEEKRLVVSALGNVPTVESLALVTSQLEDGALKEEACLAAVAIAEKIAPAHGAEVAAAMQQVAKLTANPKLAAQAKALARKAKK